MKNLLIIFLILVIMPVSVSAYTETFNTSNEFPVTYNGWKSINYNDFGFNDSDDKKPTGAMIYNEKLTALKGNNDTIPNRPYAEGIVYYDSQLSYPINITASYININPLTFYGDEYFSTYGAYSRSMGIGINYNSEFFSANNTELYINWQSDRIGVYFQNSLISYNSTGSDHNNGNFRIYMNETFIGYRAWSIGDEEPSNWDFYSYGNYSLINDSRFFFGSSTGDLYSSRHLTLDDITILANGTSPDLGCTWEGIPTEEVCDNLIAGYYNDTNSCTTFQILECIRQIQGATTTCTYSDYPTLSECNELREGYYNGINDCTPFEIIDCISAIPETESEYDDQLSKRTGLPQILAVLQNNIKIVFGLFLIIGIVVLMSQTGIKNPLVLIMGGVVMAVISSILGLIPIQVLIIMIVLMIVLLFLFITVFRGRDNE